MLELTSGVSVVTSMFLSFPSQMVSEERTGAEDLLASHNCDVLTSKKLS
jgi:hypothetical protein